MEKFSLRDGDLSDLSFTLTVLKNYLQETTFVAVRKLVKTDISCIFEYIISKKLVS